MPTRPSKREDEFQAAARIVAKTTGQQPAQGEKAPRLSEQELRSQADSILGKLGGSKGGLARAKNLSPRKRKEIARNAARARRNEKAD